jgi:hypothetical protein
MAIHAAISLRFKCIDIWQDDDESLSIYPDKSDRGLAPSWGGESDFSTHGHGNGHWNRHGVGGASVYDRGHHARHDGAHLGDHSRNQRALHQTGVNYTSTSMTKALGISQSQYNAYREGVTDIEGKRYDIMGGSSHRFAGRYQMGGAEITETASRLGVPRPSTGEFLHDPAMQERFFESYTLAHHDYLMEHSSAYAGLPAEKKLEMLGYAHNQGVGGAEQYLRSGRAGSDAFGTSGTAYFGTIRRRLEQAKPDSGLQQMRFDAAGKWSPDHPSRDLLLTPPKQKLHTGREAFLRGEKLGHDPSEEEIRAEARRNKFIPKEGGVQFFNFDYAKSGVDKPDVDIDDKSVLIPTKPTAPAEVDPVGHGFEHWGGGPGGGLKNRTWEDDPQGI